jgi:acyl-CoA thioesterase-2
MIGAVAAAESTQRRRFRSGGWDKASRYKANGPGAVYSLAMHPHLHDLLQALALEPIEQNLFRGHHPPGSEGRLFGGQIMAQALIAAGRTVPQERAVHSLHGYFLRPGRTELPVLFTVDRIRDGTSFTTRRVVAVQHGKAIFEMSASFQVIESGLEHQFDMPPLVPPTRVPDVLKQRAFIAVMNDWHTRREERPQPPHQSVWFKANGALPDDPLVHEALLVYQSDHDLLSTSRLPHRGTFTRARLQRASLDHAMWFHHRGRVDDWLLYDLDSPSAAGCRGYNRGAVYAADGRLIASAMQESLMRLR